MTLGEKQRLFARLLADLYSYIYAMGWECTLGDGYRDPRAHGAYGKKVGYSAKHSLHKLRLAQDMNLFVDGKYITNGNHTAYKQIGKFWKDRHGLCRWGGEDGRRDANHFSLSHDGKW